ncbi:ankyrin repeat protein [Acanthamoeba polyphaga moumouvirus]|uniref:Ankyrin repeat protein n=1 Tax=Acanthamoeba polyphaga moumouvirus TaxID=1269028 RepID=L7RDI0_9VIRU|nr:ankyrin repeat protein [Acanthamoeba polyphaga moumouvirus]AGC02346.1 ankyrin repeat protein [Acanthamoeba polyphaga moumouvirus]
MVKYLVENGANIHAENNHTLLCAHHNGYFEIVKYLVDCGVNIHTNNNAATRSAFEKIY